MNRNVIICRHHELACKGEGKGKGCNLPVAKHILEAYKERGDKA
jgi:hypothetical protein